MRRFACTDMRTGRVYSVLAENDGALIAMSFTSAPGESKAFPSASFVALVGVALKVFMRHPFDPAPVQMAGKFRTWLRLSLTEWDVR